MSREFHKHVLRAFYLGALMLAASLVSCVAAGRIETKLGPLDVRLQSLDDMLELLGRRVHRSSATHTYVYVNPGYSRTLRLSFGHGTSVSLEEGLDLALVAPDDPGASKRIVTEKRGLAALVIGNLDTWKTSKGISLGSRYRDVLKVYGRPSQSVPLAPNETELFYAGDDNCMSLTIDRGRVSRISLFPRL